MISHSQAARIPKIMPYQEAITYFSRTSNDTFSQLTVFRAHRKKVNKADKNFAPEILIIADLIFSINANYLTAEPTTNDYLIDSHGIQWVVLAVVEQQNAQMYNLAVQKNPI